MNVSDLMNRVKLLDENLARDLAEYIDGRQYGLVYEASKPEFVRLWKKPVVRGDLVNILPPRGENKSNKCEEDSSDIIYRYINNNKGRANLRCIKTQSEYQASMEDLVSVSRFDCPVYCGLKERDRIELGGDAPFQVLINGENYHALQLLAYTHANKVDCIYIDPPYNTGAKDWKYNNNYVSSDDSYRHSKWLTFMEDRLKVAKKLLNPKNSVLIVTIDEKEYLRLGLLLEQIYPEAKIQMVSSVINGKGVARDNEFARVNEYIFFVRLGESAISPLPLPNDWTGNVKTSTTEKIRWGSLMRSGSGALRSDSPGCFYPIYISKDLKKFLGAGEVIPIGVERDSISIPEDVVALFPIHDDGTEGRWQYSRDEFLRIMEKGYVRISTNTRGNKVATLRYISEGWQKKVESGEIPIIGKNEDGSLILDDSKYIKTFIPGNQWWIPSHDATEFGSKFLSNIIGKRFSFPKSIYAVYDTLRFCIKDKPDALVVDFFAGSGTTLHAINLMNAEDGGKRRCISITNNEVSEDEQEEFSAKGLRQGDDEWEKYGIANYVTWPRTKCSIKGRNIKGEILKGNYGTKTESYEILDVDVINPDTNKKVRSKVYRKVKKSFYPSMDNLLMGDGFKTNAIFFELTYLEPSIVSANLAFSEIAPLLWLRAGGIGEIIQYSKSYIIGETYAVLFDYSCVEQFITCIKSNKNKITHIFVVTDIDSRYRNLCGAFSDKEIIQLYESYLRSFEINAGV